MIKVAVVNEESVCEIDMLKQMFKDALHDICLLEEVIENLFALDMEKDEDKKKDLRDEIHELMEEYYSLGPVIDKVTEASARMKANQDS